MHKEQALKSVQRAVMHYHVDRAVMVTMLLLGSCGCNGVVLPDRRSGAGARGGGPSPAAPDDLRPPMAELEAMWSELQKMKMQIADQGQLIGELRAQRSDPELGNEFWGLAASRTEETCSRLVEGMASKTRAKIARLEGELRVARQDIADIRANTTLLTGRVHMLSSWRRVLQGGMSAPEPGVDSQAVRMFKRTLTYSYLHPGGFGYVNNSSSAGSGHRLLAEESGPVDCSGAEINRQITAITAECCDQPGEDCSGGKVHNCNAGCGALLMPFWAACHTELGQDAANTLREAVQRCTPPGSMPGSSGGGAAETEPDVSFDIMSAQMFMATCPAGLPAEDCMPLCEMETNGFLLLLNARGNDAKLSCELHHGLYSWVGGSADGGFIGTDAATFFSAVAAAAAGTYIVTLLASASISTDLVVHAGQVVAVNGDERLDEVLSWGNGAGGGFVVQQFGLLSLSHVQIDPAAAVTVTDGGRLSFDNLALPSRALATAMGGLCGAGSRLIFDAVTVPEQVELGVLRGTVTSTGVEHELVLDPPDLLEDPLTFVVVSGPCTLAAGGRCVGRWPGGYLPNERCEITTSAGADRILGNCPVFDTEQTIYDYLTFPDGQDYGGDVCPVGVALAAAQLLHWQSDSNTQGWRLGVGDGLPQSRDGAGGGWQICFEGGPTPFVGLGPVDLAGPSCPIISCPSCTLSVGSGTSLSLIGCDIPAEVTSMMPSL
eukprot:SAG31_NODE_1423_length_8400_cov_2.665944_7_plen_718_part_00